MLGTPEGVDRAFKKLDTIKSEIVFWEAGAQAPQLLADGQVVMAYSLERPPADCNRCRQEALQDRLGPSSASIGTGGQSPRTRPSLKKPIASSAYASDAWPPWPTRPSILPMVQLTRMRFQVWIPQRYRTCQRLLKTSRPRSNVDPQFWADHGDELKERFNAWLAK